MDLSFNLACRLVVFTVMMALVSDDPAGMEIIC